MAVETPALTYRDLELSLDRADHGRVRVRLRGLGMDRTPPPIVLDFDELAALRHDQDRYGRRLGKLLFAAPGLADAFGQAKGSAFSTPGHGLRLRLVIPPDVSELHRLAWETIVVPGDDLPLAMDERVLFSRTLGGRDLATVSHHPSNPKIVAAVANPTDLADPLDVADELARLRAGVGDLPITELVDGRATLDAIGQALAEGADVLYLACHGLFDQDTPLLILEDPNRRAALVSGKDLAAAVRRLPRRPSLVVLASCQSAGDGDGEVLAATGPLLVDAGVPAVVAMQGSVGMATLAAWLSVFWSKWRTDGAVDRAVAAARWAVREADDWWMPVAFVRVVAEQVTTAPSRRVEMHHAHRPRNYVAQPALLAEIRASVLGENMVTALTAGVRMSALHGMGGIGKTVMAWALCDDAAVQAHFPDGILWVTLGERPAEQELVQRLREWVESLGGLVTVNAPSVEWLRSALAQTLEQKRCLLVVDDVWRKQDAEPFLVGGAGCRCVLTTRDAALAEDLRASVQRIPLMALEDAVQLLEEWSDGVLRPVDWQAKATVVERLGRLPLAVRLAGPQLKTQSVDQWLAAFDARKLRTRRVESLHDSLEKTFALSLDALDAQSRRLYVALAIFREDEATPAAGIFRLWEGLAGLDPTASTDLLRDLADRALLVRDDGAVVLHDLLRDLMALELGEAGAPPAHRALVAAYRKTQGGDGWHTAPDDGYLYGHLAYHLEKLALSDMEAAAELEHMLTDDAWMRARTAGADHQYDGFLADLDLYWGLEDRQLATQLAQGNNISLGPGVQCALIRTSIHALSGNYSPDLVGQAVKTGLWSVAHALSVAVKVPNAERRAAMFAAISRSGQCDDDQCRYAMQAGLDAALAIHDERDRASALAAFARNLQGELKEKTLRAALDTVLAISSEGLRSRSLAALVPDLQGEMLRVGLDAVLVIQDERDRAYALADLAPNLQGEMLRAGLDAALAIRNEWARSRSLAALAPNLQGELKEKTLRAGLDAALAIQDEEYRTYALASLARNLQGELKDKTLRAGLDTALAIQSERARSRALTAFAPDLQGELLRAGLDAALTIQDEEYRSYALSDLAHNLQGDLLRAGLDAALAIQNESARTSALASLAHNLQGEIKEGAMRAALDTALAIQDEEYRSHALASLAPNLQGDLLRTGLDAALAIQAEEYRSYALADLAPNLQGELLRAGLDAALTIKDEEYRSYALAALAPNLQGALKGKTLPDGLDDALTIQDEESCTRVLAALALKLNSELKGKALQAGLDAALSIQDEELCSRALVALALNLQSESKGKAIQAGLDAALAIQDEWARSSALAALAPNLHGELLRAGLAAALFIQDEGDRSSALAAFAPNLQGEMLRTGLDAALAIQAENARSSALAAFAPNLQGELLRAGLDAALAIEDERDRTSALAALAPNLQGELLRAGLDAALAIQDERDRTSALAALAPNLQGKLLREGLDAALVIQDERDRTSALVALAPNLQGELLREGLDAALAIREERARTSVLAAFALNLQGELREKTLRAGLDTALAIQSEWARSIELAALAPILQGEMKEDALRAGLDAAFAIEYDSIRSSALAAFIPNLQGEMKEKTLRAGLDAALAIQSEWARSNTLADLAPNLQGEMLRTVLVTALAIQEERVRSRALAALAPHLTDPIHLRQIRHQIATDLYTAFRQSPRADLLNYLATPGLIAPPLFTPDEVAAVAEAIVDVTTKWRWV